MHEYSITNSMVSILEDVAKKNNLKKISKVNIDLNPIANIEPDSINFYYEFMTMDNKLLKGAELIFSTRRLKIECRSCRDVFEKEEFIPECPKCGSSNVKNIDIDDIKIISIET